MEVAKASTNKIIKKARRKAKTDALLAFSLPFFSRIIKENGKESLLPEAGSVTGIGSAIGTVAVSAIKSRRIPRITGSTAAGSKKTTWKNETKRNGTEKSKIGRNRTGKDESGKGRAGKNKTGRDTA